LAFVVGGQSVYQVGLAVFEHCGGDVPFLHHELMGNAQLVEYQIEYLDVVACRLSLVTEVFKGQEVPVADNDKRAFLSVAVEVISDK
jgi:hypothetical protein